VIDKTPHDSSRWIESFRRTLERPELALADYIKSNWPLIYWLMRMGEPVLEVGAGTGRGCVILKRLQPWKRITALDREPGVCNLIREYAQAMGVDLDVVCGDVSALPFRDSFQTAFSEGLFEHYPDPAILGGLREMLRVSGDIVISVPTDHFFYIHLGGYGDERLIPKMHWMGLFDTAGRIAEVSLLGNYTEEASVVAVITRRQE